MGDYDNAIKELNGILRKEIDRVDIMSMITRLYIMKKDYEEAVARVAKARADQQQLENAAELMKASKGIQGEVDPNSILATVAGAA